LAEILNLRLARKAKARKEAEQQAQQNRVIFGQTKAEKTLRKAQKQRLDKVLDAGKIETSFSANKPRE
jgi:Domain of unknown function (DUF4169)